MVTKLCDVSYENELFPHSDHLVALHTKPTMVVYTLFKISSEVEVSLDFGVSHFPLLFVLVFLWVVIKVRVTLVGSKGTA